MGEVDAGREGDGGGEEAARAAEIRRLRHENGRLRAALHLIEVNAPPSTLWMIAHAALYGDIKEEEINRVERELAEQASSKNKQETEQNE